MRVVVLVGLAGAVLVLLASFQLLSGLVRTLPIERGVRQRGRGARQGGARGVRPASLEQLEKIGAEALGGDRYALALLARRSHAAADRCGVDPARLAAIDAGAESPAKLLRSLDALEAAIELPPLARAEL